MKKTKSKPLTAETLEAAFREIKSNYRRYCPLEDWIKGNLEDGILTLQIKTLGEMYPSANGDYFLKGVVS